jgi:hypothetical protein
MQRNRPLGIDAMATNHHIAPHWDKEYRVWFAVHYVNGRPDGSVTHGKTKAECLRSARLLYPSMDIVDVTADAKA